MGILLSFLLFVVFMEALSRLMSVMVNRELLLRF
jgi:hypothetical protein